MAVEAGSATVRLVLLRLGQARLVKAVVVCCVPVRLGRVCYGGLGKVGSSRFGGVCHGEISHGMAVLVGFVQVRYGQSWSGGCCLVCCGQGRCVGVRRLRCGKVR